MKKFNIRKKVAENLELPQEYALAVSKISILDFQTVEIINYKSIIEYGETLIRINTKEKIIKLEGKTLNIENITDEEIKISGQIHALSFE